jgi:hypothetical protein
MHGPKPVDPIKAVQKPHDNYRWPQYESRQGTNLMTAVTSMDGMCLAPEGGAG